MSNLVSLHSLSGIKRFSTGLTTVRFLSSMDSFMSSEYIRVPAHFVTEATHVFVSTSHGNRSCKEKFKVFNH